LLGVPLLEEVRRKMIKQQEMKQEEAKKKNKNAVKHNKTAARCDDT
jgi:hypothetical protein